MPPGLRRKAQDRVPFFEDAEIEIWDRVSNELLMAKPPSLEFAIAYMCAYEERETQDSTALLVTFPNGDRIWLNGKFWRKDW